MKRLALLFALVALSAQAQDTTLYSHRSAFSVFAEYSNTSSHIFLGVANDRQIGALGATYSRRMIAGRYAAWHWEVEARPITLVREPTQAVTVVATSNTSTTTAGTVLLSVSGPSPSQCTSITFTSVADPAHDFPSTTFTSVCGNRMTYAGGLSPIGQRVSFAPRHRLQPFIVGNGGFMVSTRDLPSNDSSRFNFTFEMGGGLEYFRDHRHSWSVEYRLHHLSNDYTGNTNPGIDSQFVKVTYSFGR